MSEKRIRPEKSTKNSQKNTKKRKYDDNAIQLQVEAIEQVLKNLDLELQQKLKFLSERTTQNLQEDLKYITDRKERVLAELSRLKQNKTYIYMGRRVFYYNEDISNGTFPIPVVAVNEIDEDPVPEFNWIERCILAPDVEEQQEDQNFLAGCQCEGDCLTSDNCLCRNETGNTSYIAEEIQVEPGWPVYECNPHCFCSRNCSNRVVQHGPKFPIEVFKTKGKGWGVRAKSDIPKGRFVCEYIGEIISPKEAERRGKFYDAIKCSYLYDLDMETQNNCLCIDANNFGNVARFLNHSCEPNLQNYQLWYDHLDKRRPRIAFFTCRNVKQGEELTFDYRYQKAKDKENSMTCQCGASKCKGLLL